MKARPEEAGSGQGLPTALHSRLRRDPRLVPASSLHCPVGLTVSGATCLLSGSVLNEEPGECNI